MRELHTTLSLGQVKKNVGVKHAYENDKQKNHRSDISELTIAKHVCEGLKFLGRNVTGPDSDWINDYVLHL